MMFSLPATGIAFAFGVRVRLRGCDAPGVVRRKSPYEEVRVRSSALQTSLRPSDKSPPFRQVSALHTTLPPSDKPRLRAPADRTTPVPAAGVPAAPTRGGANRAGWRPARAAFGRAAPPEPGTARPLPRPSPVPLPRRPPGWTGPPDRRRTVGPGLRARPGRAGPGRARPRRTPVSYTHLRAHE